MRASTSQKGWLSVTKKHAPNAKWLNLSVNSTYRRHPQNPGFMNTSDPSVKHAQGKGKMPIG